MAKHLSLSRCLFLVLIVGCGQVPAEREESGCLGILDLEQRGLLKRTIERIINIESPDFPNSLKSINAMQKKRKIGEENYSIACVVITFSIENNGKLENLKIVSAFPNENFTKQAGFNKSAIKSLGNSTFMYEEGGSNEGVFIMNFYVNEELSSDSN